MTENSKFLTLQEVMTILMNPLSEKEQLRIIFEDKTVPRTLREWAQRDYQARELT